MKPIKKVVIAGAGGMVIGVVAAAAAMAVMMPSMMLKTYETRQGFDETVDLLQRRIEDAGWVVSGVSSMNRSLAKEGVDFKPRVTLVKLCRPDYAESVLTTDRYVSVMMPCTFSVWEGDDGKVYLTKMNMALMGRMFGGNIADIIGNRVAADEAKMLDGLLKQAVGR